MSEPTWKPISLYECIREVYSRYRTEAMNKKYYGSRLSRTKRWNTALEIMIGVGASSAIGVWAIWRSTTGSVVWAILTGGAAVVAVAKPFLRLPDRIERYTRLFSGHAVAVHDLSLIVSEIARIHGYTPAVHTEYLAVLERIRKLTPDDDPSPGTRLLRRCFQEVKAEIPVDRLWWPTREEDPGV